MKSGIICMHGRRAVSGVFAAALVLLAVLACALSCARRPADKAGEKAGRAVLRRGIGLEVPELDPHLITGLNEYQVVSALFEGLVAEDPVDLHPVPGAAESWDISADGLVYTFHLRAGARWSNGDPLTADDFVASFRRILTPSLGAPCAGFLHILKNAAAFNRGELAGPEAVGARAADAHTLVLTLEHPSPHLLRLLAHQAWFPVHLPSIARCGPVAERGNNWARPGTLVCNGPFQLTEWRPNQLIAAGRNPFYWDAAAVGLDAIHFLPIESVDAEERAFRAGQLDVTDTIPFGKIDSYRRNHPELLRTDAFLGTYFYRINVTRPLLDDARVRRALGLAIDRAALTSRVLRGGQAPAECFTPPGIAGYTPPTAWRHDPVAARRLLVESGHPGGAGLPPVEILFNSSGNHQVIAEVIQEMWRRELGLEVRLANQEVRAYLDSRRSLAYDTCRSSWIADIEDPLNFLEIFTSSNPNNQTGWRNPDYDALVAAAAKEGDAAARNRLLGQAEALLAADAPVIPIYHYTHIFLISPRVRNWHPTLLDHHPYKHVRLSD